MEHKFLVIEVLGDGLKDLDVIGRYGNPKDAYTCRDIFKNENKEGSYIVAKVLD